MTHRQHPCADCGQACDARALRCRTCRVAHDLFAALASAPDRFAASFRAGPDGCLIWTGAFAVEGYGLFRIAGDQQLAHRIAWEFARGPIPSGMEIHHECRVKACVNVAHLLLVTPLEHRALEAALRTHCLRGHPYSTHGRTTRKGHRYCRTCETANHRAAKARREGLAA